MYGYVLQDKKQSVHFGHTDSVMSGRYLVERSKFTQIFDFCI